jgi:hypothetical protein
MVTHQLISRHVVTTTAVKLQLAILTALSAQEDTAIPIQQTAVMQLSTISQQLSAVVIPQLVAAVSPLYGHLVPIFTRSRG